MNWGVAVPILAVILTAIVILLLWYWWSSSREPAPEGKNAISEDQPPQGWMQAITRDLGVFRKLRAWTRKSLASAMPTMPSVGSRTLPARQTGELVEAVRLFRDLATGGLVVEIGGRRYFSLSEMTDDTLRRRFIGIAESMTQFAAGAEPAPALYMPPPAVSVTPATPAAPMAFPVSAALGGKGKRKSEKEEQGVLKSVAEEIEELLQYRLALTPDFSQRSIHIRESHGGAIQVEVDGHYYDGVGEVADEPVQAFLQDIVREWEARK